MARDCCHLGPRTHRPGTAGEQEDLKTTLLAASTLFPLSSPERQLRTRNLHNACGGSAANGHSPRTGILWCALLDDKADGIGDTMSAHRLPCLLGRFIAT